MGKVYCPKCNKKIKTSSSIFYITSIDVNFSCEKCSIFIVILKEFDNKTICSKKLYFKDNNLNYYNYDQFVYKCNNSSCDRQFWMTISNSFGRNEFITWKEKISYRYGDSSTIETILREYDIYYEFIFIHNNNDSDVHNALFIKMHKISKTEDMINFIIRYIDNLIFC